MHHDHHPASGAEAADLNHLLTHCRRVAVVGLSPKPERASHQVAAAMQQAGWKIIAVNPLAAASGEKILGQTVYATLAEAAQHEAIDLVDVFRHSQDVPPIIDQALALPRPPLQGVWLQLGVRHDVAVEKARAVGLKVVQDRCLKIEWRALR